MEDKLSSAAELPYFEGDFWPNVLEESIKELDQEEEEKRKQAEAAEAAASVYSMSDDGGDGGPDGKKKGQKKAKKSNKSKANQRKNSKKSNTPQTGNDLSAKIFATMEKHKEVFFVIRLHSAQSAASLAVSRHIQTHSCTFFFLTLCLILKFENLFVKRNSKFLNLLILFFRRSHLFNK